MSQDTSIENLCIRAHATSKEKGWLEGEKKPYKLICRLFKSELYEAFEDWRNNKGLTEVYYEYKHKLTKEVWASSDRANGFPEHIIAEKVADGTLDEKPCGIPIELADFVIRLAQYCGTEGLPLAEYMAKQPYVMHDEDKHDFLEFLDTAESHVNDSLDQDNPAGLGAAASLCLSFCADNDIDLWSAIHEKEAYNATRSRRHGGKKAG